MSSRRSEGERRVACRPIAEAWATAEILFWARATCALYGGGLGDEKEFRKAMKRVGAALRKLDRAMAKKGSAAGRREER